MEETHFLKEKYVYRPAKVEEGGRVCLIRKDLTGKQDPSGQAGREQRQEGREARGQMESPRRLPARGTRKRRGLGYQGLSATAPPIL